MKKIQQSYSYMEKKKTFSEKTLFSDAQQRVAKIRQFFKAAMSLDSIGLEIVR